MSDGVGCCGTSMQLWCMVSTAAESLIATDCPCCRAGVPAVGAGVVLDLNAQGKHNGYDGSCLE